MHVESSQLILERVVLERGAAAAASPNTAHGTPYRVLEAIPKSAKGAIPPRIWNLEPEELGELAALDL